MFFHTYIIIISDFTSAQARIILGLFVEPLSLPSHYCFMCFYSQVTLTPSLQSRETQTSSPLMSAHGGLDWICCSLSWSDCTQMCSDLLLNLYLYIYYSCFIVYLTSLGIVSSAGISVYCRIAENTFRLQTLAVSQVAYCREYTRVVLSQVM